MPTCFITTSIPYVNGAPHIGHALEFVQADAFARFQRLIGADTRLLTGTDDNSLSNVLAAEREGVPVADLVARNTAAFERLLRTLDIAHDDFIRTSLDPRHLAGAARLWQRCAAAGDIYRRQYHGLYCVGCEQFYAPAELTDGLCPEHQRPLDTVEEDNYFFRLSRYTDPVLELIDTGRLRIVPEARRNEVRAFVAGGLADISISRTRARARGWGIPVPGDPTQVMYVWFDALTNYINALDYATDGRLFERFWQASDQRLHVIGKGISRFHAVYWPALLLSAGLTVPTTLFVHGYLTVDGEKISKSRGNGVDPGELADEFGVDAVRYWLLRAVPATGDADYTRARLAQAYTADLARGLGNLVQRTLSMLQRYTGGRVPDVSGEVRGAPDLAPGLGPRLQQAIAVDLDPRAALAAVWEVLDRANRFAESTAPWHADDAARRANALYTLAESVRVVGEALRPFLPRTAAAISAQLGREAEPDWLAGLAWGGLRPGDPVGRPVPLFPRLERVMLLGAPGVH